jgi:hypothetical protein
LLSSNATCVPLRLGAGGEQTWMWVFDPIDGTKSFITGKPLFGTLVALLKNGSPVLGVGRRGGGLCELSPIQLTRHR